MINYSIGKANQLKFIRFNLDGIFDSYIDIGYKGKCFQICIHIFILKKIYETNHPIRPQKDQRSRTPQPKDQSSNPIRPHHQDCTTYPQLSNKSYSNSNNK